jgi:hypothetical protein
MTNVESQQTNSTSFGSDLELNDIVLAINSISIGMSAGQNTNSIAIGSLVGHTTQYTNLINIGMYEGQTNSINGMEYILK